MSCILDTGYALGCAQTGGVKRVFIGTYDADVKYTLDADNVITAVVGTAPTIYPFEQNVESAGLVQNGVFSPENLTVYLESVLSIKLYHWTKELRNTYNALAKAPVFAIVESNMGELYLLGLESAGRASEGNLQLGVTLGDMNGANISIMWKSPNGAYLMTPDVIGDFTIGAIS